jgi:hypothetical protein
MFPQQSQDSKMSNAQAFNVVFTLLLAHASCITPFLRCHFGVRYFQHGLWSILVMIAWGSLMKCWEMWVYLQVWLVVMVIQRTLGFWRNRKQLREHTRYTGWPWVAMLFVRSERLAKMGIEPGLCLLVGSLLCGVSEGLGAFVMLGFFSILFSGGLNREIDRQRVMQMHDQTIEGQDLSHWHRKGIGDL